MDIFGLLRPCATEVPLLLFSLFENNITEEFGLSLFARNRSIEENLKLFEQMKNGEFPDGHCVLRCADLRCLEVEPIWQDVSNMRGHKSQVKHFPLPGRWRWSPMEVVVSATKSRETTKVLPATDMQTHNDCIVTTGGSGEQCSPHFPMFFFHFCLFL